ncbi:hypothetical protein F2Q68_00033752 [Brassica cretica]|uniref:Reverse transcriptase domain-containing protein n=2 Tax=Brassica cretica TaxID=69181 RepID=A0ABQ7EC80_BRACR|nr:hypothetical protein F2Q68_00033752 [Brassica cretica]KAF3594828.1 hypothetical protein DY000_02020975 [Brassica cretica]
MYEIDVAFDLKEVIYWAPPTPLEVDLESDFMILENSRPLLELAKLGDELDVNNLLLEIKNPPFNFVFPPNVSDFHDHLNFKENFIMHGEGPKVHWLNFLILMISKHTKIKLET